ncbi:MAG: hypothetical protein GQ540_03465 [Lutibacter sp.]|uniref:hypothetical protein n=1 Tax=Lutibacter sp. TaxID=1925666 RepID=UPI001A067D35|nr:hypothetical protein [Lutibacter sp.]NOR27571.1 hypothetical protein [Lutibacter sp.]
MTDYEYLCTDFIDEVIKCFKDNGFSNINNNEESGGTFLIGYKSNLYCIESDYQVAMVKDSYDSCGSGSNYALGSMKTLYNWDSFEDCEPEVYITEALSAAEYFSCGVYKPFNIVSL